MKQEYIEHTEYVFLFCTYSFTLLTFVLSILNDIFEVSSSTKSKYNLRDVKKGDYVGYLSILVKKLIRNFVLTYGVLFIFKFFSLLYNISWEVDYLFSYDFSTLLLIFCVFYILKFE